MREFKQLDRKDAIEPFYKSGINKQLFNRALLQKGNNQQLVNRIERGIQMEQLEKNNE